MTGFHLLHVIAGIGILMALLVGMRSPALRAEPSRRRRGDDVLLAFRLRRLARHLRHGVLHAMKRRRRDRMPRSRSRLSRQPRRSSSPTRSARRSRYEGDRACGRRCGAGVRGGRVGLLLFRSEAVTDEIDDYPSSASRTSGRDASSSGGRRGGDASPCRSRAGSCAALSALCASRSSCRFGRSARHPAARCSTRAGGAATRLAREDGRSSTSMT